MNYFEGLPKDKPFTAGVCDRPFCGSAHTMFTMGSLRPGTQLDTGPGAADTLEEAQPLSSFNLFCKDFSSKLLVLSPTRAAHV